LIAVCYEYAPQVLRNSKICSTFAADLLQMCYGTKTAGAHGMPVLVVKLWERNF